MYYIVYLSFFLNAFIVTHCMELDERSLNRPPITNLFSKFVKLPSIQNCMNFMNEFGYTDRNIPKLDKFDLSLELWHKSNSDINGTSHGYKEVFSLDQAIDKLSNSIHYDKNISTTIFLHGFRSSADDEYPKDIANVTVSNVKTNVLVLNTKKYMERGYIRSAYYLEIIGREVGNVLAALHKDGSNKLHLIGHSLGAHLAGFVGKTFKNMTGSRIKRITGLDPAGPCFYGESSDSKLHNNDADFVDVIHTNSGVFGYDQPLGDADFYPNNGDNQPGCLDSYCNHARSWRYYMESIVNGKGFLAIQCQNWTKFILGKCDVSKKFFMGYSVEKEARGIYYLLTNNVPLYGLGTKGIKNTKLIRLLQ